MIDTLQQEFGFIPSAPTAVVEAAGNHYPPGYLGKVEVRAMEADGWAFSDQATKVGLGYAVWSQKGDDRRLKWLLDPELYPEKWPEGL